jgi:hypothetical protein
VELTTISVPLRTEHPHQTGSPLALLKALEIFAGDDQALREHFDEIEAERDRERKKAGQQGGE